MHFDINIKSDRTKVKHCNCRRDFGKGNYKGIRKSVALIDWNDKMKNKTATECWNILRGELDSAIDSYVPMKKQGKRSKKKHLSKEAFRKIRHKQNMWRVYKHTGKDKDYEENVRDKVGPLEDNFGNIVTQEFVMAEELDMHFSSVFTREYTSSLPVPETKFKGSEGERLGQLVVARSSSY